MDIYGVSKGIHMSSQNNNWVTGLGGKSECSDYGLSLPFLCSLSASVWVLQTSVCALQTHLLEPNTFHHIRHYKSDSLFYSFLSKCLTRNSELQRNVEICCA